MNDRDEPTAWEDINPPMASAPRHALPSRSSDRLAPAKTEDFRNELTACLALVAPVGMTEEAKRDWLTVAWATVGHLPADLLRIGCKAARQSCDHPSKIVPAIMEATSQAMMWRQDGARDERERGQAMLPKPDYVSPDEAANILREFGLKGGSAR